MMDILALSVSGGAMILAAALLRALAGDRLVRRGYVVMWILACLRLLVPVRVESGLSLFGLLARHEAAAGQAAAGGGVSVFGAVWLTGACAALVLLAAAYWRSLRAFRLSVPAEGDDVRRWLNSLPGLRRIRVRTLPGLRSPLTYGVLRPVILLPDESAAWPRETLELVLTHEYIHIRRFDAGLKLLAAAAVCVHWFNPAAWLMYRLLDRDMELSCDGAVVDRMGPGCRARYARLLVDLKSPAGLPLSPGFGRGGTERRVLGVMDHRRATGTAAALTVLSALVLTVTLATSARSVTPAGDVPDDNTPPVTRPSGEQDAPNEPSYTVEHPSIGPKRPINLPVTDGGDGSAVVPVVIEVLPADGGTYCIQAREWSDGFSVDVETGAVSPWTPSGPDEGGGAR